MTAPDNGSAAADPAASAPADAAGSGSVPEAAAPGDPANAEQDLTVFPAESFELDLARQEAAERTADLQRVSAEYANYRRRVDRDREQTVTQAKASVITDLLPVLDDIERAGAHGDLTGSFKAVADKLTGGLTKLGLQQVGAEGDPFDPAQHEAVQFETSPEVSEPTVTSVFRRGYRLGDRLVRPAVVVVTGPADGDAPADPAGS